MSSGTTRIACLISFLVLAGCASNDLMIKRQSEAEAKLEHLIQTDRTTGQQLNELTSRILTLEDQLKASTAQNKQIQTSLQELRTSQDEYKARLVLLSQRTNSPKIEVVNTQSTEKNGDNSPPADYLKAFGLYSSNNFSAAIKAFEAFLAASPDSEYAANALYWIGECHYSQSDLPQARVIFQKTADKYPKSSKAPDAMLKLGFTLSAMNERDKAKALFENLIKTYPGSHAAAKARERLTAH